MRWPLFLLCNAILTVSGNDPPPSNFDIQKLLASLTKLGGMLPSGDGKQQGDVMNLGNLEQMTELLGTFTGGAENDEFMKKAGPLISQILSLGEGVESSVDEAKDYHDTEGKTERRKGVLTKHLEDRKGGDEYFEWVPDSNESDTTFESWETDSETEEEEKTTTRKQKTRKTTKKPDEDKDDYYASYYENIDENDTTTTTRRTTKKPKTTRKPRGGGRKGRTKRPVESEEFTDEEVSTKRTTATVRATTKKATKAPVPPDSGEIDYSNYYETINDAPNNPKQSPMRRGSSRRKATTRTTRKPTTTTNRTPRKTKRQRTNRRKQKTNKTRSNKKKNKNNRRRKTRRRPTKTTKAPKRTRRTRRTRPPGVTRRPWKRPSGRRRTVFPRPPIPRMKN